MNSQQNNTMAAINTKNDKSKGRKSFGLLDGPDPDIIRVIRCTLYHLDGTQSYIVTKMTNYTHWHTAHVKAAEALNEYVYQLASEWIQISKFHTEIGTMRDNVFTPCIVPHISTLPIEIPLNKVFIPGTHGQWVTPSEAKTLKGGINHD